MKAQLLITAFALFSLNVFSQPVVTNGSNVPAAGLTAPFSVGIATNGPGAAGADQTWDFSGLSFTSAGTLTVVDPSSTTHASSFSSANYAYTLAGTYSYFKVSADKMEVLAYSITSPGSGNDYSTNPRTVLKFPFSYNESFTDTWQKVGGSENDVTTTYDGYGTLKTPNKAYTNVIRVKEDYGSGVDYQWYTTNPLMAVMVYDHKDSKLYMIDATATNINEPKKLNASAINLYPNPVKNTLNISTSIALQKLEIADALGRTILTSDVIDSRDNNFELPADMKNGIYYVKLYSADGIISRSFIKAD